MNPLNIVYPFVDRIMIEFALSKIFKIAKHVSCEFFNIFIFFASKQPLRTQKGKFAKLAIENVMKIFWVHYNMEMIGNINNHNCTTRS
jgi:hypothetical protein